MNDQPDKPALPKLIDPQFCFDAKCRFLRYHKDATGEVLWQRCHRGDCDNWSELAEVKKPEE